MLTSWTPIVDAKPNLRQLRLLIHEGITANVRATLQMDGGYGRVIGK